MVYQLIMDSFVQFGVAFILEVGLLVRRTSTSKFYILVIPYWFDNTYATHTHVLETIKSCWRWALGQVGAPPDLSPWFPYQQDRIWRPDHLSLCNDQCICLDQLGGEGLLQIGRDDQRISFYILDIIPHS